MWEAFFVCTGVRFGGFLQRLRPARLPAPNRPLEGWAGCTNRQLVRGLFSYKSPTHQPGKLNTVQLRVTQRRANFSAGYKRDLALDDKSVSSTAVLDQQRCPLDTRHLLKRWTKTLFAEIGCRALVGAQPSTGRLGWAVRNGSFLRGLFSYKSPLLRELQAALAIHPQRRFQRQSISHAAARDQRLCLWKPQPFEKGWRKLYFAEIGCREVES